MVILKTSAGDIKIKLLHQEAPETVKNFLQYVNDGHYNNTLFHRVIDNFVIQGGGMNTDFEEKPTRKPVINEADNRIPNEVGTLAMARTMAPNSATSQFFINVKDNHFLNHRDKSPQGFGYCVFARVVEGMDVIDKIRQTKTARRGYHDDVPVNDIILKEAVCCSEAAE